MYSAPSFPLRKRFVDYVGDGAANLLIEMTCIPILYAIMDLTAVNCAMYVETTGQTGTPGAMGAWGSTIAAGNFIVGTQIDVGALHTIVGHSNTLATNYRLVLWY